jgi:cardiolipin synthase
MVDDEFKRFPDSMQTLNFRPTSSPLDATSLKNWFRDHRKILVVDDDVAFVGGYNIGSLFNGGWRDTHARMHGSCVGEVKNAFVDFWNAHRLEHHTPLPEVVGRSWQPHVLVHRNDPYMRIFPIRGMYLEAIDRAQHHVYMTHAYFVPDRAFRRGLADAAARGVDVRVLVPWRSNHVVADWLARRFFADLMDAGVRLFAYRDIMIHAKTATIDGLWSTVGTANIDRLSLYGNYEVNLEIHSQSIARQMEAMFHLDTTNAFEIDPERWSRRPPHVKFAERALESLAPLV